MKKNTRSALAALLAVGLILGSSACGATGAAQANAAQTAQSPSAESQNNILDTAVASSPEAAPPASDENKTAVRIALAQDQNEPDGVFRAASKLGYLQEELDKVNAEIEWLGFAAAGPAVNEALIGESVDLAAYGNLPPVNLAAKGFDVKIIGFISNKLDNAVIVAPDSDIQTVKDLEGKKVVVGRGTISDEYWGDLVGAYGIDESTVEVVNDPANGVNIFAAGQADAIATADLVTFILQARGVPFRVLETTRTSHPEFATQGVIAGRGEWLKEHGDIAVAILRAYVRAYDYVVEHPEEAPGLFATDLSPVELIEALFAANPGYLDSLDGEITEAAIARLQRLPDFLKSHGYIDATIDVHTLIDDSYYKQAAAEARGN
ncbi:MAG: ABC transporter substrate-binding protein [Clostridiales bacterium]|jgi:sulfonate transport system substrate-binding protein|nr:ABC transporter substrate-binding protein [Clostridiales bacterium]